LCGTTTAYVDADPSLHSESPDQPALTKQYHDRCFGKTHATSRRPASFSVIKSLPELNQATVEFTAAEPLPVNACPPLVLFLIDLSLDSKALATLCEGITVATDSAPDPTRVGIVLYTATCVTTIDLSTNKKKLSLQNNHHNLPLSQSYVAADLQALFPPLSKSRHTTLAQALRLIGDWHATNTEPITTTAASASFSSSSAAAPFNGLNRAVSAIANLLSVHGTHPGKSMHSEFSDPRHSSPALFNYCGAKLFTFANSSLSSPSSSSPSFPPSKGDLGSGGFNGSCAIPGQRHAQTSFTSTPKNTIDDEDAALNPYLNDPDYHATLHKYELLGISCNQLAMPVELLLLSNNSPSSHDLFPLTPLSLRSGGAPPLLFDVSPFDGSLSPLDLLHANPASPAALVNELLQRMPWHRPSCFGAGLRIRTSPTLSVITSPASSPHTATPSSYLQSGGILGPCYTSPADPTLIHLAHANDTTTLSFDIAISPGIRGDLTVDGVSRGNYGASEDVEMDPAVQIAFMYTAMVPPEGKIYDFEKDLCAASSSESEHATSYDDWTIVRRLRVFSTNLATASTAEDVYQAVDIECLAATMYNKLLIAAIDQGLHESRLLARDWILSSLQNVYKSAEEEELRVFATATDPKTKGAKKASCQIDFSTRLVNRLNHDSGLTDRDIILAQGHATLASLPLLIYSLVNCDALRPSEGGFQPSANSRLAAALSLASMDPLSLVKMLVPRLELWNSAFAQGPTIDRVSLGNYAMLEAIASVDDQEHPEAVLVMDSPRALIVYFVNTMGSSDVHELGEALEKDLQLSASEYRSSPGLWCVRGGGEEGWRFIDGLVEDSLMDGGYSAWCDGLAADLFKQLKLEQ
jgi:hypothetical protein